MDAMSPKTLRGLTNEATKARPGRSAPANLRDQASQPEGLWESLQQSQWPTPLATDSKNNGATGQGQRNSPPLNHAAGGALNPEWVEQLMGFPAGWTEVESLGPLAKGRTKKRGKLPAPSKASSSQTEHPE
jgi:hypothetical protein